MATTYQRKDGRWAGDIYVETSTGVKKRKTIYGKTRREVEQKIAQISVAQQKNSFADPGKMDFSAFSNKWLEETDSLRANTRIRYESLLRIHINPAIGSLKLATLSPPHLSALYSSKRSELAPRTVLHIHRLVHRILEVAVKWNLLARNPADAVDAPRAEKADVEPLSTEQAMAFIETAKGNDFYALFVLAITTGMRQGELLGLEWSDIDLRHKLVSIRHTLNRNTLELAPVKSKASRRTIQLSQIAFEALLDHKEEQQQKKENSSNWIDTNLVFTSRTGSPVRCENLVRRYFQPLLVKAGIPRIRFHDLRHTAASILLAQNEHPKVVQQLLGHSSISLTLDTYSHVSQNTLSKVASKMDDIFLKEQPALYLVGWSLSPT